ncbi:hypothetical protein BQ8420_30740 [Nocardiopsis sp. JB363]|nr:hypothetical protein BQ8420_30740 [Nocardiopsis sp. JB363]
MVHRGSPFRCVRGAEGTGSGTGGPLFAESHRHRWAHFDIGKEWH